MATSMGTQATTPQNGLLAPSNTIPKNQVQPGFSQYNGYGIFGQIGGTTNPFTLGGIQNKPILSPSSSSSQNTQTTTPASITNGGIDGTGFHSGFFTGNGPTYSGPVMKDSSGNVINTQPSMSRATTTPVKTTPNTPINNSSGNYSQPVAQASYSSGQSLPAVGSAAYTQAQSLAHPAPIPPVTPPVTQPTKNVDGTVAQPGGMPGGLYGQALQNLQNQSTNLPQNATSAQGILGNFAQNQTPEVLAAEQKYNQVANNPYMIGALTNSGMAESVSAGAGQQFASNYANQLSNANQNVQNALTGQSQQIGSAENLGTQALTGQKQQIGASNNVLGTPGVSPTLGQYGQTYYSPYGSQGGTSDGSNNLDPQSYANQLAQQVISGKMTYTDASSALGYVGKAGTAFLQQAIQSQSPGFNINQANVNSQTQGALSPAINNATAQLNNLQSTLANSPASIKTAIPAFNNIIQALSGIGINSGATQALKSALTDARAAMSNALGVANNSTASTYDSYVHTLLPDGITPDQITNAISQFNSQIVGKLGAYSSPGTTQPTTAGQTTPTSFGSEW